MSIPILILVLEISNGPIISASMYY